MQSQGQSLSLGGAMALGKRAAVQWGGSCKALGSVRLRAQKPGNGNGMVTRGQAVTAPSVLVSLQESRRSWAGALERLPTSYPVLSGHPLSVSCSDPLCSDGILHWRRIALATS